MKLNFIIFIISCLLSVILAKPPGCSDTSAWSSCQSYFLKKWKHNKKCSNKSLNLSSRVIDACKNSSCEFIFADCFNRNIDPKKVDESKYEKCKSKVKKAYKNTFNDGWDDIKSKCIN
ncbi:hypothetical protein PIROE2DRAFT_14208 [Piromyces sp. E2]|nr:hypothetical protein PIROE2DRAFT_14208 [Piromyces sp. E2]|eukprot:OUM60085.1 hypothetical protein PIROE2DRAFT_14208 [Piromyces sp. E2]